jgi:hypothetical protein
MTDGSAKPGTKQQILTEILAQLSRCRPKIKFTLLDKDPSEINACCTSVFKASIGCVTGMVSDTLKRGLPKINCLWHMILR